jgi:hypothetical protein
MLMKIGHFEKLNRNTWKSLKCGAGEDQLDRSCDKMKNCYKESRRKYPIYHNRRANWIGPIFCRNCVLNHVIEHRSESNDGKTMKKT